MTKRRKTLLALVGLLILGVVLWAVFAPKPEPEPSYNGKPLSQWVACYSSRLTDAEKKHTDAAIRHIGTNALPYLLKWIQYEQPEWKNQFDNVIRTVAKRDTPSGHPFFLLFGAQDAFEALGTNAAPAVPFLIQSLKDRRPTVAIRSAAMLGFLKLEPGLAVPALTNSLRHSTYMVRLSAMYSLGEFGTNARPALPVLLNMLNDQEIYGTVTNVLQKIDPEALKRATQK